MELSETQNSKGLTTIAFSSHFCVSTSPPETHKNEKEIYDRDNAYTVNVTGETLVLNKIFPGFKLGK